MPIIETNNLTKVYESRFSNPPEAGRALNNFTFNVNEGEIFGLLGPNGAGKTTLIKILLAIVFPTSGTGKIFGKELNDHTWKIKVGYLPENHKFPLYLTGEQVLEFYGGLSHIGASDLRKKIPEVLNIADLAKWQKVKIKKYSKGMLQRLGLAQALLNEPDLLFLDEPTEGVDPIGRKEIRDLLLDLKHRGKTIFLNSHLLSEVELICDRVAILNKGDLVKEGSVDELTRSENIFIIETSDKIDEKIRRQIMTLDENAGIGETEIHSEAGIETVNKIIDTLRKGKVNIKSVRQKSSTLEELFIKAVQKNESPSSSSERGRGEV